MILLHGNQHFLRKLTARVTKGGIRTRTLLYTQGSGLASALPRSTEEKTGENLNLRYTAQIFLLLLRTGRELHEKLPSVTNLAKRHSSQLFVYRNCCQKLKSALPCAPPLETRPQILLLSLRVTQLSAASSDGLAS